MISVTWQTYLIASFVLLGIYYAAVVLLYAKKTGKPLLGGREKAKVHKPHEKASNEDSKQSAAPADDQPPATPAPLVVAAQNLVDELQAFAAAAGKDSMSKEELQSGVKQILAKYPGMAGTDLQDGISTLIVVTLENSCAVHLNDIEVSELWQ